MFLLLCLLACEPGRPGGDGGAADGGSDGGGQDGGGQDGGGPDGGGQDGGGAEDPVLWATLHAPGPWISGEEVGLSVELRDPAGALLARDLALRLWLADQELARVDLVDGRAELELALPGCADGPIRVEAIDGSASPALTEALQVAPAVQVLAQPGLASVAGALAPLSLALVDTEGQLTELDLELQLSDLGSEGAALVAGASARLVAGLAEFPALQASGPGALRLSLRGPAGCPLNQPVAELLVGLARRVEPTFLPAARQGEDYLAALPASDLLTPTLPAGLEQAGGWLLGVPELAGAQLIPAAAWDDDGITVRALPLRLAVLPPEDAALPAPGFAPEDPGPYEVGVSELEIPAIAVSWGTVRDVALRVTWPAAGGAPAPGRFPVLAFHHAAHAPPDIYDAYTELHAHWASHGLVVASVDGQENVSGFAQSWQNLEDMSTFQLASLALLAEQDADEAALLHGHLDLDRALVAGHSRGGGASLLSLWRDPSLMGAICLEQVSPLQTPNQDWTRTDGNGDRALPPRPLLFFSGSLDADEPWPLVDVSYEQSVGPTAFVTIHGANHEDSVDAGTPGGTTSRSTISREARHAVDQHYSTAFLYRFGAVGPAEAEAAAGDLSFDLALFGEAALSTSLSPEDVSVHGRRQLARSRSLDAFQAEAEINEWGGPNLGEGLQGDANEAVYTEGLAAVGRDDERALRIAGWAMARHLAWDSPDAELALFLDPDGAAVDLMAYDHLVLRLARDCPPPSQGACPALEVDLEIVLWDADGAELSIPVSEGMGARGIVGRHWSSALLPLDAWAGIDLERVEGLALRLAAADWTAGELWIDDLRFE